MPQISPTLESDNKAHDLTPRRPPVMSDSTLKTAFRALVDELENATARCKAVAKWPSHADLFARKSDVDRAEACLIGWAGFARRRVAP
jgi:hypothetical protein